MQTYAWPEMGRKCVRVLASDSFARTSARFAGSVSFSVCGSILALLSTVKRVVLTTSAGAGETVSQKRSALAGPM